MKYIALPAAVATLPFFVDPDKDTLTLDEIFSAVGRDPEQLDRNKRWLQNRLIPLRHYELVATIYTKGQHPRRLDKIQLTPIGKTALASKASNEHPREITAESMLKIF